MAALFELRKVRPITLVGIAIIAGQCLLPSAAVSFDQQTSIDRIWHVHIFGEDDRGLSSYPFVGQIFSYKVGGEFSGFLCSANHLVTVAHGFADAGKWKRTKSGSKPSPQEFGDYLVRVEACNRTYRVDDVAVATTNSDLEYWKDYAVLTLGEEICPGVEIPRIGLSQELLDLDVPNDGLRVELDEDFALVGYYRPSSVQKPTSTAVLPDSQYEYTDGALNLEDLGRSEQYAAVGRIFALSKHFGELFLWHYVDATFGGSGGPLIVDAGGSPMIIGMHTSGGENGNHSIAAQGPFLDFIGKHCDIAGEPFD